MSIPTEFAKDVAAFPPVLRALIEAELAAGNEIVEICSGFPAPPVGACLKLAKRVSTRARESDKDTQFYERNTSNYSGEFTDAKRFYFVLEPPLPPEPEPDLNAIRAALQAKQAAQVPPELTRSPKRRRAKAAKASQEESPAAARAPTPPPLAPRAAPLSTVERFRESMVANYERWHDGIGYDLDLLKSASPEELVEIENLLLSQPVSDWRDVEALAALNSPRAQVALRQAQKSGDHRVATAVARYAPGLISDAERTATLVKALERSEIYGGFTQALLEVEEFHPPEVVEALLRGALARGGDHAVHFAAMLMFIHGRAKTTFDWNKRPFFLRFNTADRAEREKVFRELCEKIGVPAGKYLDGTGNRTAARKTSKAKSLGARN